MGYFVVRLALIMLAVLPAYVLLRFLCLRKMQMKNQWAREVMLCLFSLFTVGLLALVWQPGGSRRPEFSILQTALWRVQMGIDINWVPFETIIRYWGPVSFRSFAVNIVGNILMFCPMGFCLPLLWRRWQRFWKTALAGLGFTCVIEFVQLFLDRKPDVDDLILNLAGAMLGYVLWKLAIKVWPCLEKLAAGALCSPAKEMD